MRRDNRLQTNEKKKRRKKKRTFLKLTIVLFSLIALYFVLHTQYFDINGIAVVGNKEISDEQIIKESKIKNGDNIFDTHPLFVKHRIKKNLYIESVKVKRKLPKQIEIVIKEKEVTAQAKHKSKYIVFDEEGKIIEISKEQLKMTLIEGIKIEEQRKGKEIKVKNQKEYEKSMNIIKKAYEEDLYFSIIEVSGNNVNGTIYGELLIKGIYADFISTMESGALKNMLLDLYQKGVESGTVSVGKNNYCSFTS